MRTHYLSVQSRGTIAIPPDIRRRLHLDAPGAQVRLVERDDGGFELEAVVPVAADQAWFWTDRWQKMEREVDTNVAAGRVTTVESVDALFDHLDHPPKPRRSRG